MPQSPLVCVALPVYRHAATLPEAVRSILSQTFKDFELRIILNGSDDATIAAAQALARTDPRISLHSLPEPSLAKAVNHAAALSSAPYLARMDADDTCTPDRLERQVAALAARPDLAAIGCAWNLEEVTNGDPRVTAVIRPPQSAAEARWRLLLSNSFAHGSMLIRRDALLAIGGYDESLPRAQDYDLWLRMVYPALRSGPTTTPYAIAALPEVLYTHRRHSGDAFSGSQLQAQHAAACLTRAWASLPQATLPEDDRTELAALLTRAMAEREGPAAARAALEQRLADRPTRELLLAYLWLDHTLPPMPTCAAEVCRDSHVKRTAESLLAQGYRRIYLYGAGAHTGRIMPILEQTGIVVEALMDDAITGERFGRPVVAPHTVPANACVLISSDAYEDLLWVASEPLRARGVVVRRLYA